MWIVTLTGDAANKQKAYDIWGRDYFPRRFYYRKDARDLDARLKENGVEAEWKKEGRSNVGR